MRNQFNSSLPTISIIVVNWNGKKFIGNCFSSIEKVNYPREKLEVIMVDNGSRDGSCEFVNRKFPGVKIIKNTSNLGFAKPSNDAGKIAKGEYLAFLNNDAKVTPDWLTELVKVIQRDKEIACVGSRILTWDGTSVDFNGGRFDCFGFAGKRDYGKKVVITTGIDDIKLDKKKRPTLHVCAGSMLVDKSIFLKVGGFDEDYFAFTEDVDFCWRLWILGYKVYFVPKSVVYHKEHGTLKQLRILEKSAFLVWRNSLFTLFKNYETPNLKKILPATIILFVKMGLALLEINKKDFYISEERRMKPFAFSEGRRYGLAYFSALEDFFENIDSLLKKRKVLQKRRVRKDNELFPLFDGPFISLVENKFHKGMEEYKYSGFEYTILKFFNIEKIFDQVDSLEKYKNKTIEHLEEKNAKLKNQIENEEVYARQVSLLQEQIKNQRDYIDRIESAFPIKIYKTIKRKLKLYK